MSARGYALHNVCLQLSFFTSDITYSLLCFCVEEIFCRDSVYHSSQCVRSTNMAVILTSNLKSREVVFTMFDLTHSVRDSVKCYRHEKIKLVANVMKRVAAGAVKCCQLEPW